MIDRFKKIKEASKQLKKDIKYTTQKQRYERKSLILFAKIVAGFGFGYGLLIILMQQLRQLPYDHSGWFLILFSLLSLCFAQFTKWKLTEENLDKTQYFIAAYGAYAVIITYCLSQIYDSVSIFLFVMIVICTSRVWAHSNKYMIFTLCVTAMVVGLYVLLVKPEQFTWLYIFDYVIIALFAIGLNIVHVEEHYRTYSLKSQLEKERDTDMLTGLYNRKALIQQFEAAVHKSTKIGLLMVDVDNFKSINDTFGHHTGDLVLVHIANLLKGICGSENCIARVGGDEFVVLICRKNEKLRVLEMESVSLLNQMPVNVTDSRRNVRVTLSIGACMYTAEPGLTLDHLMGSADAALYQSKNDGRNQATIYNHKDAEPVVIQNESNTDKAVITMQ